MKKIILLAGLLLCGIAQAQISVTGNGGQVIENDYEYITHTLLPQGMLKLHVTNTSEETIYLKLKVVSMQNTTGTGENIQFCFGETCYFSFSEGGTVPNNPVYGLKLEPGEMNPNGDKFYLGKEGIDPGADVIVDFAFVQYDLTGAQIGDPLVSFRYRYAPTAGTNDFSALQNMGITLKNTVVNSQLELSADQNAKMEVYNLAGQLVKSEAITEGSYAADLSGLSAAIYIAKFTNEENKTSQIRIVKN